MNERKTMKRPYSCWFHLFSFFLLFHLHCFNIVSLADAAVFDAAATASAAENQTRTTIQHGPSTTMTMETTNPPSSSQSHSSSSMDSGSVDGSSLAAISSSWTLLLNKTCNGTSGQSSDGCTVGGTKAHCNHHYGRCECDPGYKPGGTILDTCIVATSNKKKTNIPNDANAVVKLINNNPMVTVLVVLTSMFIFMCFVLQLFAKARFRNASRSIFANPQKLELAKAQELRRMSQLSQLSSMNLGGATTGGVRTPRSIHRSPAVSHAGTEPRSSFGSISSSRLPPAAPSSLVQISNEAISISIEQCHLESVGPRSSVIARAKSRSNSISSSKLF